MKEVSKAIELRKQTWLRLMISGLWQSKPAIVGLAIILLYGIAALSAPLLAPHGPYETNLPNMLAAPSWDYPLGCDELGRCILSRIIYGTRVSLFIGVTVIAIGVGVGAPLGAVSAYYGGKVDFWGQRLVDIMLVFPGLLLALVFIAILGVGLQNVMIAIGISTVPIYIRLVRGSVLSIKEEQYVQAARAIGASDFRIILRHVLLNCLSPIIVQSTLYMAIAILWAAGLGFLGLGVSPPTAEWGAMLNSGKLYISVAPHVCTFPGLAIFVIVVSFNLLGDGLRDALDPKFYRR